MVFVLGITRGISAIYTPDRPERLQDEKNTLRMTPLLGLGLFRVTMSP
jgi:hypothetical protein